MREVQQFQVALKAFAVDGERLLMVRETDGAQLWELPGGRIDVGEENVSPIDVLLRELAEELGPEFTVEIGAPVTAWVRAPDPRRAMPVFLLGYRCRYTGGEIVLSAEHVDFAWVTRAECGRLTLAPGYAPALERFWSSSGGGT